MEMAMNQNTWGRTLGWGVVTAGLYGFLLLYSETFERLAHTTLDTCLVHNDSDPAYHHKTSPEQCAAEKGSFIEGTWWYVFAPIAMALALSYAHGIFTGLFWDVVGLKAKK
jgi:hypothetical protein